MRLDEWTGEAVRPTLEDHLWHGRSLPPEIDHRYYAKRSNHRTEKLNRLIEAATPDINGSLAGFHRMMRDTVEYASVFAEERPDAFEAGLLEYLAD